MRIPNAGAVALGVLLVAGAALAAVPDYPKLGPPWPVHKQPAWIGKGMVFVGNWEPLQWVYRKNWQNWGNARSGALAEQIHKEEHSEAAVIGLKALGVNMVLTSFHKGFGIANEKANMEEAREFGRLLHKHGLKMGVYVSALLLYEELYAEYPEAKNWHRINYDGTPDVYGLDGFRHRAFLNHPEYINYMKRVCELAVNAGADLIHFDTVRQTRENFHPLAEEMFRDWLKRRYPAPDRWFFRTGLHHQDFVKIPHYPESAPFETFDQPIMQEYLQFKAQLLADYAAEISTFIRSLNPECAVEFNPGGINGANTVLTNSIDHARLLPWIDAYWTEERDYGEYTREGGLISKIRSIKVGQQFNSVNFSYTGPRSPVLERELGQSDPRLRFAEAMAFNRQCLGNLGTPLVYKNFPETGRRYIQFFWKNFDLLAKGDTAADVAVLRTFASLAYNNLETHRETMLAEQALIQSQLPFDMIDDHNLDNLSKYKVVVVADQECLSDSQVGVLREYVRKGGGLVATGNTSRYDDWRRDRERLGLEDVLGIGRDGAVKQNVFGKGRAAYLRELTPGIPVPPKASFITKFWAPPANAKDLLGAIRWAGTRLNWEVTAPPFVATEVYHQPTTDRYILHLVNYNCRTRPSVPDIRILFRMPGAENFSKVTAYSPDEDTPVTLRAEATPGGTVVTLPRLGIYCVLSIERQNKLQRP